jgi:hypothetical protein
MDIFGKVQAKEGRKDGDDRRGDDQSLPVCSALDFYMSRLGRDESSFAF